MRYISYLNYFPHITIYTKKILATLPATLLEILGHHQLELPSHVQTTKQCQTLVIVH